MRLTRDILDAFNLQGEIAPLIGGQNTTVKAIFSGNDYNKFVCDYHSFKTILDYMNYD
jgi:hypothetical protein